MKVATLHTPHHAVAQRLSPKVRHIYSRKRCNQKCMAMDVDNRPGEMDAPFSPLPAELQVLYDETTKNMVELNRARMKALEDLRMARQVIAQLEAENVDLKQKPVSSNGVKSMNGKVATLDAPKQEMQMSPPTQQAPASMPPPVSRPSPTTTITLQYYTGWDKCFLHYSVEGKGWTSVPGERMDQSTDGAKTKTVFGKSMEFVLTNGNNDWDVNDPYNNPGNYRVRTPGVYRLRNGKLDKLSS